MEITLKLLEEFDVYELYLILYNKRKALHSDNNTHADMIRLLEGNDKNKEAKDRLRYEFDSVESNSKKIAIIDNLIKQLLPLVDKQLNNGNEGN